MAVLVERLHGIGRALPSTAVASAAIARAGFTKAWPPALIGLALVVTVAWNAALLFLLLRLI